MAASKTAAVPVFKGRNVPLSEIAQASGIGMATIKRGTEFLTSVMLFLSVTATSIAITALTSSYTRSSDISTLSLTRRSDYA